MNAVTLALIKPQRSRKQFLNQLNLTKLVKCYEQADCKLKADIRSVWTHNHVSCTKTQIAADGLTLSRLSTGVRNAAQRCCNAPTETVKKKKSAVHSSTPTSSFHSNSSEWVRRQRFFGLLFPIGCVHVTWLPGFLLWTFSLFSVVMFKDISLSLC